jgi:hypothetical protein
MIYDSVAFRDALRDVPFRDLSQDQVRSQDLKQVKGGGSFSSSRREIR